MSAHSVIYFVVSLVLLSVTAASVKDSKNSPPVILRKENEIIKGTLKKSLIITCPISTYPEPSIIWMRENMPISSNNRWFNASHNQLFIRRLNKNTLGEYKCEASNNFGNATWTVTVIADENSTVKPRSARTATLDEETTLSVDSLEKNIIFDINNSSFIKKINTTSVTSENESNYSTVSMINAITEITSTRDTDAENTSQVTTFPLTPAYSTIVTDGVNSNVNNKTLGDNIDTTVDTATNKAFSTVTSIFTSVTTPQAISTPFLVPVNTRILVEKPTLREGSQLILSCKSSGFPKPHVFWFKEHIWINTSERMKINDDDLTIFNVNMNDNGQYECYAANSFDSHNSSVNITIIVPVKARVSYEEHIYFTGSQLNLHCEIDGYPEPSIYWTKDEKYLGSSERVMIYLSGTRLKIYNVTLEDSGVYECRAQNDFDVHASSVKVIVKELDACTLPALVGECANYKLKWYFDTAERRCRQYYYGGCGGNGNSFETEVECKSRCSPQSLTTTVGTTLIQEGLRPDACHQYPDPGSCSEYYVKWYYDSTEGDCYQFVFSGCDGNENRFDILEECESHCKLMVPNKPSTTTTNTKATTKTTSSTPSTHLPRVEEDQCRTPESLSPCGRNVTAYYYDSDRGDCQAGYIGDCRYANRYRSEEECLRACGWFRGIEVCRYSLDPGPCHNQVPKYYWDELSLSCLRYTYGGCGGGPNRFSTAEECEDICGQRGNKLLPECESLNEECEQMRCENGSQRTRTVDGCDRCTCVQIETDCTPLKQECEKLKCTYGMTRKVGADGCDRCSCIDHPCAITNCHYGERCGPIAIKDHETHGIQYSTECRLMNKVGACPPEGSFNLSSCRTECNDDADCRGPDKCCARGCSKLCLELFSVTTLAPQATHVPGSPQAPELILETELEVTGYEGGKATLRCLFRGNPPSNITWKRGELTIDGKTDRYRMLTDGALEIVSLYRNDSGVYSCVADNVLGTAKQDVVLQVNDPVEETASISGEKNAVIEGKLGESIYVRCLAYGYPSPAVAWFRASTYEMVPFKSAKYDIDRNGLLIKILDEDTLGQYDCQAYNGNGKPASWIVTIQTREEQTSPAERPSIVAETPKEPQNEIVTTVSTLMNVSDNQSNILMGSPHAPESNLETKLEVTGYEGGKATLRCLPHSNPPSNTTWRRGELMIDEKTDRYRVLTDGALEIVSLYRNDSGVYSCVADNVLGTAKQDVVLQVNGPVEEPAGISGEENAVIESKLGESIYVRCLAYGYPPPSLFWYRGLTGAMVPFKSDIYEIDRNGLKIQNLDEETMGQYVCQAYNGISKPASWTVTIRTREEQASPEKPPGVAVETAEESEMKLATTMLTLLSIPDSEPHKLKVPVMTHLVAEQTTVPLGHQIHITCDVDGYPEPSMYWLKDGVRLNDSDTIQTTTYSLYLYLYKILKDPFLAFSDTYLILYN